MNKSKFMKVLCLCVLFILALSTHGQTDKPDFIKLMDEVITRAKEISLYAGEVNWDSTKAKMYASSADAEQLDDLKPAFEILINDLRDHHATVRKTSDYSILASFSDHKNSRSTENRTFDNDTWAIVNDVNSRFEHALLPDNIGYLKIVGVGPNVDGQEEANRIRTALNELKDKRVDKWIVDLRYNGGGNVNVMIDGIAPLYDTEKIVGIQGPEGEIVGYGEIKDGDFWYFEQNSFEMEKEAALDNPKIAVLISRWTWSSGEFVAAGFKGQENVKFFGEKTGGYTTNNSWDIIDDKIALIISTGIYCDRNGNVFTQNIEPDEEIVFRVEKDKADDPGIRQAISWLQRD